MTAAVAGCASVSPVPQPLAFTQGVWRIRIDVDSAPTRRPPGRPVFGTIDFGAARYYIDFRLALNRPLPNGAYIAALPQSVQGQPILYKLTVGDTSSFDDKVIFTGHMAKPDSIVGTWTETLMCCVGGGRFSLWRGAPAPARR